ncbi:plasmid partitioning protein RepB [Camelimonas fluminis]|uniref:Plasmid partitioning protein RepB n=1 Tax=Camelimonas fluminis TaxID=1576911 RepID=A0ABV7UF27_9HYPH|nr:plasmid partitioning protein RepB [Camelimonas fluminis]GHE72911.1 plasmid partitioning protein RepB [Camelimonas fluminis]
MASAASKKNRPSLIPQSMLGGPANPDVPAVRASAQDVYASAATGSLPPEPNPIKTDEQWQALSDTLRPAAANPAMLRPERNGGVVGAFASAMSHASMSSTHYADLLNQLKTGSVVIELDPGMIEPSFVADRMNIDSEDIQILADQISAQGQLIPILVRPHPKQEGRFETAYGHRRTLACARLGKTVKAVVRELSDDELVIAQGQENNARLNLSYIERARFARALADRNTARPVIADALALSNVTQISWFLTLLDKIPEEIISAIGPAQGIGRRRWEALGKLIDGSETLMSLALKTIEAGDFTDRATDDRFEHLMRVITRTQRPRIEPDVVVTNADGAKLAKCLIKDKSAVVKFDRGIDPKFSEFVIGKLNSLYAEYSAQT